MVSRDFFKAGHLPTLLSAFFYFDMSFMVWMLLGPLAVQISSSLHLDPAHKSFMVALPVLAGALLRVVNGVLVDRLQPKLTGLIGQVIVISGLLLFWAHGVHSFHETLALGLVLGVAGASFAVALPLASRWYPAEYQGIALGITGAGNSGTVFAALFAPSLAALFGWTNVLGLAVIPLSIALLVYIFAAKNSPQRPPMQTWGAYLNVLRIPDCWRFMFLYGVTFGGFSGLAASLSLYFNAQYGLNAVTAGYFTAACVFAGSMVRPIGGALADHFGGVNVLSVLYSVAATLLLVASFGLPHAWMALTILVAVMLTLGMGNGAVFQLVPQRFKAEMGVMTGLVGMTGGVGGFYLAWSLGLSRQWTGSYQAGFVIFAVLALLALTALSVAKRHWRSSWALPETVGARI